MASKHMSATEALSLKNKNKIQEKKRRELVRTAINMLREVIPSEKVKPDATKADVLLGECAAVAMSKLQPLNGSLFSASVEVIEMLQKQEDGLRRNIQRMQNNIQELLVVNSRLIEKVEREEAEQGKLREMHGLPKAGRRLGPSPAGVVYPEMRGSMDSESTSQARTPITRTRPWAPPQSRAQVSRPRLLCGNDGYQPGVSNRKSVGK